MTAPGTVRALLEEILADLGEHGIRPTPLNVIAAALDRGHPERIAVRIAEVLERLHRSSGGAP